MSQLVRLRGTQTAQTAHCAVVRFFPNPSKNFAKVAANPGCRALSCLPFEGLNEMPVQYLDRPRTRLYLRKWLYHRLWCRNGISAPRSFLRRSLKTSAHCTLVSLPRLIVASMKSLQSWKTQFPVSQNVNTAHYRQIMRTQSWREMTISPRAVKL